MTFLPIFQSVCKPQWLASISQYRAKLWCQGLKKGDLCK